MNPFAEHAANMRDYEEFCSEPVSGEPGENTVTVGGGTFTAIVGQFIRADIFINGGISPHLVGEVIVQKSALPPGTVFSLGQEAIARPIGGGCHQCLVYGVHYTFTEWRLQLYDRNEGA